MKIGIIGATGWLGSALGAGLLSRQIVRPGDLVLRNRSGPRPDYHGHADVVWARDMSDLVAQSDVIVVSVRPADWRGLDLRARVGWSCPSWPGSTATNWPAVAGGSCG